MFNARSSFGQTNYRVIEKFFFFINSYQADSLENYIHDDFQITRTFTSYSNNKNSFLGEYLTHIKAIHGKFYLIKEFEHVDHPQFLVEDKSDYLDYLQVADPKWKLTFIIDNDKVKQLIIDTTADFQQYATNMNIADDLFMTWLHKTYPDETLEQLYNQEGLFLERLKSYANKNKKTH